MTTVYHPDPEINAGVIADALDAERADLAAGYAPRRWRCPCGTEHSRGHFGTIGTHRCLACGYVGDGGVMLDGAGDAAARPECRIVDQILPWPDVREGDLLLWDGEFRPVVAINPMDHGNHAIVFDPDKPGGIIPCGTYAAVRRYQEG